MLSLAPSPVGGVAGGVAAPRFRSPRRAGGAGLGVGAAADGADSGWWTVIVVVTVVGPPAGAVGAVALSGSGGCGAARGVRTGTMGAAAGDCAAAAGAITAAAAGGWAVMGAVAIPAACPRALALPGCTAGGGLGSFDLAAFNLSSAAFRA